MACARRIRFMADLQRKTRTDLAAERVREGKALATLQVEKAAVDGERRKVEAHLGPVYIGGFNGSAEMHGLALSHTSLRSV